MGENIARLAVDIGGTFTDIVLEAGEARSTLKVLTTHDAPERAILEGSQELLDQAGIRNDQLEYFVHGTTLATNALIERPAPLVPRDLRFTVSERLAADGSVIRDLDEEAVRKLASALVAADVMS